MAYDQFCKVIGKLQSLKGMAVDESLINYDVLHHVHQCCPDFLELKVFALYVDEDMASIICDSLTRLKKLEIPNSDMSCAAIIKFLDCLEELEYMDISGTRGNRRCRTRLPPPRFAAAAAAPAT